MALETRHQHRPGGLKQLNKVHKHGRHRSKGSIEKLSKGRLSLLKPNFKRRQELSREERRNQASQIRDKKRFEYLQKRRGLCEAPFLIALIPLNDSVNTQDTVSAIKEADPDAVITESSEGFIHISLPRLKHKFTLVVNSGDNLFDRLDLLKVCDTVLFLISVDGMDENGNITMTAALAQGIPTTTVLCVDLNSVPQKKRHDHKSAIQREMDRWLPGEKVHSIEKNGDGLMLMRRIATQKQKGITMRDRRAHLLADKLHFIETSQGKGTLEVTGYLRGQTLSVNSLIHIPGWGDFKMSHIYSAADPMSDKEQEIKLLEAADINKQESLESENPVDPMDAEQTWPTEEEINQAKEERKKKLVKKVPHGMSEYQASWIPDEDAFEVEGSDEDEEEGMDAQSEGGSSQSECEDDMETGTEMSEAVPAPEKYDRELDMAEEEAALAKIKEAQQDKEFPDEMDTPRNILAKDRFARYRGLASFRTTPWDPKENLPRDYARIFQFQNINHTRKAVLKEQEESCGALPGWYITLHITDVPTYMWRCRADQPIVVYGLLKHEQKMSVVNMVLRRPATLNSDDVPIKSKETLLIQCGFRRYRCQPVFSQHTKGNKFKYERYFQPDATVVASTFAPIVFPPCSVLAFKENKDGTCSLVATGSVLSVDPNRIIVKRVVLSGHPFKVHKRSAVIRFMFFNREDIDWFKPVELRTKYGRRGHIKEPLGTHGHMKCVFNGQLKSQDTILLNLYKRIFPKWTYDSQVTFSVMENEENT